MIRPVIRSVVRDVVRPVIDSGSDLVQRYFWTADSAVQSYVELSSPVTLSGDFTITFDVTTTNTTISTVLGTGSSSGSDILLQTNGRLRINDGSTSVSSTVAINDGRLHNIIVTKTGTAIAWEIDGVPAGSGTLPGSFITSRIGAEFAGYWDGVIANLYIEDAGTPVLDMPLNEDGTTTVAVNRAATLGGELVTDNTSGTWVNSRAGAITDVTNGIRATASSTGTQGAVYPLTGLTIGESYFVSFDTSSDDTTGDIFPRAAADQGLTVDNQDLQADYPVEEDTSVTGVFTATATTMYAGVVRTNPSVGTHVDILNATIKEIPAATPYGTYINTSAADFEQFTLFTDVSPNEWRNADSSRIIQVAGT